MFSGRNSTLLPDDWEEDGFFLWPYNLGMRYVLADGCLTGLYFDLGMAFCRSPFMGQINRAFLGWKKKVFIGAGYLAAITKSDEGLIEIVETLGENKTPDDNKTLGNALANTTSLDIGVRRELWGADGMMDADFDGDDNLRILMWGTGQPAPTYRIYLDHGF